MRPQLQPGLHFGSSFGIKRLSQWTSTLAIWSGVAGITLLYMAEKIPMIRRDVLQNIPVIGGHWANLVKEAEAEQ